MSAPIHSMTGFARFSKTTPQGEVTVTLKSVNHRGLDLHFHLEPELHPFEGAMRAAMKRVIIRGHVDIRCSITSTGDGSHGGLNKPLLDAYLAAFRKAASEEGLNVQPDLNQAFRIPGMFGSAVDTEIDEAMESIVLAALGEAAQALNEFRAREGAELARFVHDQNRSISEGCQELERIRSEAVPVLHRRLREKIGELIGTSGLDPQRIAQEAAFLADRSDIAEEIARLKIHSQQLDEILNQGGEVGKKLDFLLQEMNRETNTILSKTSGIGDLGIRITDLALGFKAAIEKIREQALNLE